MTGAEFIAAIEGGELCIPSASDERVGIGCAFFHWADLSDTQAAQFCEMLREGRVKCEAPGYFFAGVYLPQLRRYIPALDTPLTRPCK